MRKGYFLIAVVLGIGASTLGQATAPESQSLQALLAEVRGLRQDLHDTLGRVHSSQILLARLQLQQAAVTRASLHLDDARSKLAEVQVAIGGESAQIKALEETLPNAQQTQAMIEEPSNRRGPIWRPRAPSSNSAKLSRPKRIDNFAPSRTSSLASNPSSTILCNL